MTTYHDVCARLEAEPKRWLVTGVAGFIGSALLEKLLALGQQVVGLDNFETGFQRNIDDALAARGDRPATFELIQGDIRDIVACRRACSGVDYLLHQAALGSVPRSLEDPIASHTANVDGFLNLLVAARDAGVRRVVYASSSAVYGDDEAETKDEARLGRMLSPYAVTKLVDEHYAGIFHQAYGVSVIGLRYFNVYGRRQDPNGAYAAVIPRWIGNMLAGKSCQIFGDGTASRDFVYIDDTVQANILAATTTDESATDDAYNVGNGERTTVLELFESIREAAAATRDELADARPELTAARAGDIAHSQASIAKIRDKLGYEPEFDVATGLKKTLDWFASRS